MSDILDSQEQASRHQLSPLAIKHMNRGSSWMIFMSVIGFLITAVVILGGVAAITNPMFGQVIGIVYLLLGVAGFFINLFWLQSALYFKKFVCDADEADAENAFIKFSSCLLFSGVITILYLGFIIAIIATGTLGDVLLGGADL